MKMFFSEAMIFRPTGASAWPMVVAIFAIDTPMPAAAPPAPLARFEKSPPNASPIALPSDWKPSIAGWM